MSVNSVENKVVQIDGMSFNPVRARNGGICVGRVFLDFSKERR